jgi:coenzyme F420-0:L-glutamate ligase
MEQRKMQVIGIRTPPIKPGDDIIATILNAAREQSVDVEDRDILAIASKAVAIAQGRIVDLSLIKPSAKAKTLGRRLDLQPEYVELIIKEADEVYGGVKKALLTLKNSILTPNSGVDRKNAPRNSVVLWPENPHLIAEQIRTKILEKMHKRVGVLIVDSRITPLRMGTIGIALEVAGFEPVRDCRSGKDIYGKSVFITRHCVADDLSSAAHMIMGETNERTPAVLIKGASVKMTESSDANVLNIPMEQCLYMSVLVSSSRRRKSGAPKPSVSQ